MIRVFNNLFNIKSGFTALLLTSILIFSGCTGDEPAFDSRYNAVGYLKEDIYNKFIEQTISAENDSNYFEIRNEDVSNMNLIFDVSFGLKEGFEAAYDAYIKPISSFYSDQATYYECGQKNDISPYKGTADEVFYHFKDPGSYGGSVSLIESGLAKAVENNNMVSIFYTDFLFDDGSKAYEEKNVNGQLKKISNKLTMPWGDSYFTKWFSEGNRIHIHSISYEDRGFTRNYYAIYFVPKNSNFEENTVIQNLFSAYSPITIDPIGLKMESSEMIEKIVSNDFKSMKNQFNKSIDEQSYAVLSIEYNKALKDDLENVDLGQLQLVNKSPWNISTQVAEINFTKDLKDQVGCKAKFKEQKVDFYDLDNNYGVKFVKPTGFNSLTYVNNEFFAVRYDISISEIDNNVNVVDYDRLKCNVKPDNQSTEFLNESLAVSVKDGLEKSKESVLSLLSDHPLFKLYTLSSIKKKE